MLKLKNYIVNWYFSVLLGLMALFTFKIAWSSEEICEVARQSHKIEYLDKFEQLLKKKTDVNQVNCNGLNLFEVAYSNFERLRYVSDVRPARFDNLILLIEHGYDVNQAGIHGNTALHLAANQGDINLIYYLVENGASINAQNEDGFTPFHQAIRYRKLTHYQTINLLLYLGANHNLTNRNNRTPLEQAVDLEAPNVLETLFQFGACPSRKLLGYAKSKLNRNVKSDITNNEQLEKVISLIEKYQELRTKALLEGASPSQLLFDPPLPPEKQLLPAKQDPLLVRATYENDLETVKELIAKGANLNSTSESGSFPLHIAIRSRHNEVAKLLINAGVNITLQDAKGLHPLSLATENFEIVKLLIEHGAPLDQETKEFKNTALSSNPNVEVAKLLLINGANINHQSIRGSTPILRAAYYNNYALIKFLLDNGADASLANNDGETPLLYAVRSQKPEIVKLLIDRVGGGEKKRAYDLALLVKCQEIIDIVANSRADSFDKNLLFDRAVKEENIELVKKLLNEGMDSYLKTSRGSSNLIVLLEKDKIKLSLLKLLIDYGANVNVKTFYKNKLANTPLLSASRRIKPYNTVKLLLEYQAEVNVKNLNGESPLHLTIAIPYRLYRDSEDIQYVENLSKQEFKEIFGLEDSLKAIELLLQAGADTNSKTTSYEETIEELVKNMKFTGNHPAIVDYGSKVDLLLRQY